MVWDAARRPEETSDNAQGFLAVPWAVPLQRPQRPYLEGYRLMARTDHDALKWLLNISDASGNWTVGAYTRNNSWLVSCIAQESNTKPLSRLPTAGTHKTKFDDEVPVLSVNPETFGTLYNVRIGQREKKPKDYSILHRSFVLFLPEIFSLTDKTKGLQFDKWNLRRLIQLQ